MPSPPHRSQRAAWRALGLAACLLCVAATAPAQQPLDPEPRALLLQKAKLVEQMLASRRAVEVAASGDAERKAALERARAGLAEARRAVEAGDGARAQAAIDDALRLTSTAFSARTHVPSDEALRQRNAELRHQVGAFRGSLAALPTHAGGAPAATLEAIDQLVGEADRASAAARHQDAHQALAQAYQAATSALSAVWAGKTVTLERKFDTPADEYRFESERFRAHEALVDLALAERRPGAEARAAIDRAVVQARDVRARAQARADAGDHPAAIGMMDEATGHLLRALQSAGVPRF